MDQPANEHDSYNRIHDVLDSKEFEHSLFTLTLHLFCHSALAAAHWSSTAVSVTNVEIVCQANTQWLYV